MYNSSSICINACFYVYFFSTVIYFVFVLSYILHSNDARDVCTQSSHVSPLTLQRVDANVSARDERVTADCASNVLIKCRQLESTRRPHRVLSDGIKRRTRRARVAKRARAGDAPKRHVPRRSLFRTHQAAMLRAFPSLLRHGANVRASHGRDART